MKFKTIPAAMMVAMAAQLTFGQGTFVYDQQSSTDEFIPNYGAGSDMEQIASPWGQSFTPSLAGIDFVRLKIGAGSVNQAFAIMYVNLHSDSMVGPVLGTTDPFSLVTGFRGNPTFFFPSTVPLTPGATYFLECVIQVTSGLWGINGGPLGYPRGSAYVGGTPQLASDFWFREGIYTVPEPAPGLLLLLGVGAAALARRDRSYSQARSFTSRDSFRSVK